MCKLLTVAFDSSWVLSKRNDDVLPVDAFIRSLQSLFTIEVKHKNLTGCEMVIHDENTSDERIISAVHTLLQQTLAVQESDNVVQLSLIEYSEPEAASEPQKDETAVPQTPPEESAMAAIDALVGAEEFKALAQEIARVAPGLKKHNTLEALTRQSYLFAINDGSGLTTCLTLLAKLLQELGVCSFSDRNPVVEAKLPPKAANGQAEAFDNILSRFRRSRSGDSQIICIDISEWMTDTAGCTFRDFLSRLEDRMEQSIVVFRVPFLEKDILKGLHRGIGDVLSVREISFVPFDQAELAQCAKLALDKWGFTMQEDAWEVFNARITEEKNDGRFYGINTVNKVIREMLYRKQLDNSISGVDDTIIKKSEIIGLAASYQEQEKTGLALLDDFIGMETIKARVEEIVAQIETSLKNPALGAPCVHMRFVGNPGTGKTTVARILGKILKERNILRNGSFFEYSGRDFCGRYVGETAPKTAAMCRDAYGSVLFIDEAYSLYRDGASSVDYGREAIDTLIAEMENHRSDLVVIMAGYTDEMNNLMRANPGLASRMPYVIDFPSYDRQQLVEIFMQMTSKSFTCQEGFADAVQEYFDTLPDEVLGAKEFSNARFVRNLFERTWAKAVLRAQLSKTDATVLTKEDFLQASGEKEFKKIMVKQKRTLGFV